MKDRFENIRNLFDGYVAGDGAVGASAAIFKDGREIFSYSTGYADRERGIKMDKNTIFRCYSMTKPVTAAAALLLMERGIIDLFEPVSDFLPEYAFDKLKVATGDGTVPVHTQLTVHNLMNMTSGIVYPDGETAAGRKMAELFEGVRVSQSKGVCISTREFVRKMAEQPLMFQPGEHWMYGSSADVLGAVVEVAAGMRFGEFLKKEFFEPLAMKDTGFYVPDEKKDRFAQIYDYDWEKRCFVIGEENHLGMEGYDRAPMFESGGAGLVSTLDDYGRFAMMLANGGSLDGVRILSPNTVNFMRTQQLDDKQRADLTWDTLRGYGYGNLCRIADTPQKAGCSVRMGAFGWDGWTGNYFIADPSENMAVMYVVQKCNGTDDRLIRRCLNAVYGAIG